MKYSIVGFDSETAELSVLVDTFPIIIIKLPVDEEGKVPEGNELDAYINGFLPHTHFQRLEQIKKGVANIDAIKALVSPDILNDVVEEEPHAFIDLTPSQVLVMAINERDNRLRASDWTQLPDVKALHTTEWVEAWQKYRTELRNFPDTITYSVNKDENGIVSVKYPFPPTL
jgi:hypothetical protein